MPRNSSRQDIKTNHEKRNSLNAPRLGVGENEEGERIAVGVGNTNGKTPVCYVWKEFRTESTEGNADEDDDDADDAADGTSHITTTTTTTTTNKTTSATIKW